MSRAFGFLALIGTGVLAFALLSGSLAGTMHAMSVSVDGEDNAMSPLAVGYSTLGIMVGFAIANLLRFSWLDLPRLMLTWLRSQKRRFMYFALACLFGAIVLFY